MKYFGPSFQMKSYVTEPRILLTAAHIYFEFDQSQVALDRAQKLNIWHDEMQ